MALLNTSRMENQMSNSPIQPRPTYPPPTYMINGTSGPVPGAQALQPNNGKILQNGPTRILCVADVRGETSL